MKAVSGFPGRTASISPRCRSPTLEQFPSGHGVLVQVLRVGVDGTDTEIKLRSQGATARINCANCCNSVGLRSETSEYDIPA
jgi:hypothetical protein